MKKSCEQNKSIHIILMLDELQGTMIREIESYLMNSLLEPNMFTCRETSNQCPSLSLGLLPRRGKKRRETIS